MKYAVPALLLAAAGTAGSLFLSIGMSLKACPLCFYQRTFVMATAAVLGIGLLADRRQAGLLCLVSVPLTIAGLGVAAFHEYLVLSNVLECPHALFGLGTAPAQSLVIFAALTATVVAGAWTKRQEWQGTWGTSAAVVVGALFAWGAIASSPPLPPTPKVPYDSVKQPLDTCRPVFQSR